MNVSRISRLVQLLGLLQAGKAHNADALAKICSVSRRTIFRDLDVLRQAGVPLLFDDDQRLYRIPGTYFLPPTNFTAEEALAVMVLCYELGGDDRLPFYEPAQSAALKLESSLPAAMRERLREAADAVRINMQPRSRLDGRLPIYQQLLGCIASRRAVRIVYDSFSDGQVLKLKLSPYRLLFSRHSWYVIGRSSIHREARTFHVGRILEMEILDDQFYLPRGFSVERYLGNAWHMIPDGPDQEVVVRFAPLVARNVAEVLWHKTQRVVEREDGSIDFHVCVAGVQEISWWILGYGDQAEVLKPAKLRQLIAERAGRLAEMYNGRA
jgi:proteasome accessory factor B